MKTISMMKITFVVLATFMSSLLFSQVVTKKIQFPKGRTGTVVKGVVKGEQTIEHTLSLRADQNLLVQMKTNVNACYFNVIAPNGDFLFSGEQEDGKLFKAKVTAPGTYKIQVYNMRSVARRGTPSSYSLTVTADQ